MKINCIFEANIQPKNKVQQRRTFPSSLIDQYPQIEDQLQQITLLPFEPTLFPKLQVYFADFPYLRYAIKTPEASNLEDLMRLSVRNGLKMNNNTLFFMEQ
jgi:hypothetical protein